MNKTIKKANWESGTAALQNLAAWDYEVHPFSDIHFRINRRLDIWPSTKRYYDTKTHQKGDYDNLELFVKRLLPLK